MPADPAVVVERLGYERLIQYVDGAAISLLVYDLLFTLSAEIEWVWPSRWTLLKITYYISRYSPLVNVSLLYSNFAGSRPGLCRTLFATHIGFLLLGFAASEAILSLRLAAVYRMERSLICFLIVGYLLMLGGVTLVASLWLQSLVDFEPSVLTPRIYGCVPVVGDRIWAAGWSFYLMNTTVTMLLMLSRGYRIFVERNLRFHSYDGRLVELVYTEGIIYYISLFIFTALNLALGVALPLELICLLTMSQRIFQSMLASRVVLHIRGVAGTRCDDSGMDLSVLEFVTPLSYSTEDDYLKSFDAKEPLPLRRGFISDRL